MVDPPSIPLRFFLALAGIVTIGMGGLLSPNWLLVTGLALFAMPVVSLATGAYRLVHLPWWFVASLAVLSPVSVYGLSKRVARRKAIRPSREAPWR